jgi:hypothetical protein
MNGKCALVKLLLAGDVINIKTCFFDTGLTNAPREIGVIEKKFGIIVSRTPMNGLTRFHKKCTWVDYRLNRIPENADGISKMAMYLFENDGIIPKGKITSSK